MQKERKEQQINPTGNEMILKEKKQEINKQFEQYLYLQKGLQEMQAAQENLQNLFEIEDLLQRTDDEQLINTIYLHLTKQFHHFNQNVQYQIYLVFESTAEGKYCKVFNKSEILGMFQDHIRSLDQMTRTIAIKIVGVITPFYLDSIETFHLINDILLKSEYHEEIKSCIHVLGNFVEGGSSNESALRLLVKGDMILNKCGEGVYLDLLNRVKLHNQVIQVNYYKQLIALICANSASSLRRKLKLIIRACRSNYELAIDFFHFCEENFDQFQSEEPQFINKHVIQNSAMHGDGSQSLSQTLLKLSAKSKSLGSASSSTNFNLKLKSVGKSLTSMLEKKVKSVGLEKLQSSLIEAIVLIYSWTKHFNVTPSHILNEKIVKSINKYNIATVKEYMLENEDVNTFEYCLPSSYLAESLSNPSTSAKSILINIKNLIQSEERRRCLNILEMDDYDIRYIEKNFQILQQVSPSLTSQNDAALLFKSFSNTFHKLSFQILSKNHENIGEFHEKHYAKFLCLIGLLSPVRCEEMYQTHIISLLKDRILKLYLPLYRLSLTSPFYTQFFTILNLTLCLLYNKLINKQEIKRLINSEILMNIISSSSAVQLSRQQVKVLKRVASQFAVYNLYEQAYTILSIVKGCNVRVDTQSAHTSGDSSSIQLRSGDQRGKQGDEERLDFQMKLLSLFQQIDKQEGEKTLLQLYDILLLFSKESVHTFETQFMELFCNYYQYILESASNEHSDTSQIVEEEIRKVLSCKFNIHNTSKASIRFIQKLIICIRHFLSTTATTTHSTDSNKMEEENQEQQLRKVFQQNLADPNSRYSLTNDDEEYDDEEEEDSTNHHFQQDFYIDGRQNIIEKILQKPYDILKILKECPLPLPRSLFVYKQQPSVSIQILPLAEYSIRAEKGLFLQGQIRLTNVRERRSKIQLKVDLKQDILQSESIYKHISTKVSMINNKPTPKIFSENITNKKQQSNSQNTRFIPFSTLVLFPYIGQFNIILSIDLICTNTGNIILTSFSQLVQINAM